jgi:beta-N-acetylhexosaminidase
VKRFLLAFILVFSHFILKAQTQLSQKEWVDSVFETMTMDEKLGQLFMVAAYSNKNEEHYKHIDSLITNCHLGGLIFFQGGPLRQAKLTNRYQALSKIPLWIGMDAEWGLGMRLDSTINFPKQMTLGAIQDNTLIYKMGKEMAYQCRRLGVHVSFSPVVDVNSNPDNPVIGNRSFGEEKENVADKGSAYMLGLQHNKVLASAKHFPGHGDTDSDSHLTMPIVKHDKKRIEDIELYPFRRLIKDSVGSIMVSHVHVPAFDDTKNVPSTLSNEIVNELLKDKMGFDGIVFTDALNMKGVSSFYKPGEVDLMAFKAGNDVLLFSEDVPKAMALIKEAAENKKSIRKELDKRVKKILKTKYWLNLTSPQTVKLDSLNEHLNNLNAQALRVKLYEKAFTTVLNKNEFLPIKRNDTLTFASVAIGLDKDNILQTTFSKYATFKHFTVSKKDVATYDFSRIIDSLSRYNVVVVSYHELNNQRSKNYTITKNSLDFITKLSTKTKVIVAVLGNAYALRNFDNTDYLLCGYEDNFTTRRIVPQVIFGALQTNATLPVSASPLIKVGMGEIIASKNVLRYSIPESVGMSALNLGKIDTIMNKAILDKATPGGQIIIAKSGTIVYNKCFGSMTYNLIDTVRDNSIYDIASITKVAATTLAVMKLVEEGKLSLDSSISFYLPEMKGTNKENLVVQEVLSHQAGLQAYLDHWRKTLFFKQPSDVMYCNESYCNFTIPVANGLFADMYLPDSVWKWTIKSDLLVKKENQECYGYVYSDLGFYIMKAICERIIKMPIQQYLIENFYHPLGLQYLGFKPLEKFSAQQIAPTEIDNYFRFQEIRGTVHDQGAAMMGGISGHAGLFSNAQDLAILMQMLLNCGEYDGIRFFKKETIETFTRSHYYYNRRGLGWDKPAFETGGPTSNSASHKTFGHTGFTGTCVWMDPENQLLFVFLSNRTYPNAENKKLINQNIRTRIHEVAYNSIFELFE